MRASSTSSLAAAFVTLAAPLREITQSADGGQRLAEEFFSLSDLLTSNVRAARYLTDPARTAADKQALVTNLFGQVLSVVALDGMRTLVAGRWSAEGDLATATHAIAVHVLLRTAQGSGKLETVEAQVFAFNQLLRKEKSLRRALCSSALSGEQRQGLVERLCADRLDAFSLRLIVDAIRRARAGHLHSQLRRICEAAAALRNQQIATVTSAIELSEGQRSRLQVALHKLTGHEMELNLVVDPQVVGGVRIQYGDQLIDGSLASSLKETRRQLAG